MGGGGGTHEGDAFQHIHLSLFYLQLWPGKFREGQIRGS